MGTGTSGRGADRPDRIRFGLGPMFAAADPYPGGLFVLLLLLAYPAYTTARTPTGSVALDVVALTVFAALFAVSQWITPGHPPALRLGVLAALTAVSVWGMAAHPEGWWACAALTAVACANLLPLLRAAVLGVVVVTALVVPVDGRPVVIALVALGGVVALLRGRLMVEIAAARAGRRAYAAAAVENERLRFARDLHDLLGHSLVTMMAKAEVAARLAAANPEAAAAAARDVRDVGKTAMTEVQRAVAGYRATSLREQIENARASLEPVQVDLTVSVPDATWDPRTDTVLAWAVREATTNILRHSAARSCAITVTADAHATRLDVVDDGRGSGDAGGTGGHGLVGLRERAEELGGTLAAKPQQGGGFRLTVELPTGAGGAA